MIALQPRIFLLWHSYYCIFRFILGVAETLFFLVDLDEFSWSPPEVSRTLPFAPVLPPDHATAHSFTESLHWAAPWADFCV